MNNNISIFIAAHRPFNEYVYPMNDMYTILYQNYLRFKHNSISLNGDEFTKRYAKLYSEGCAIHYLYEHPELLKDYVVFYHYRRFFPEFINNEDEFIEYIDKYGCIVPNTYFHPYGAYNDFCNTTNNEVVSKWINIIETNYPEYIKDIERFKKQQYQYPLNIFAMKKKSFLDMCKFSFDILEKLCQEYKLYKDEDINNSNIKFGLFDEQRMIGYFLEYTTHLYYEHNFPNLYESNINCYSWHNYDNKKHYDVTCICKQRTDINMDHMNMCSGFNFNRTILINEKKFNFDDIIIDKYNSDYIFICTNNDYLFTTKYLTISELIVFEMVDKNYESLIIQGDTEEPCVIYKLNDKIKTIKDLKEYYKDQHNICNKSIAYVKTIND